MQKPTILTLVLALALTTAAGCGNSVRDDALELVDRVETAMEEMHTVFVEANENVTTTIPELQRCRKHPSVQNIGVTFPFAVFTGPRARKLQSEAMQLVRNCAEHQRIIDRRKGRLANEINSGDLETMRAIFQRMRSQIESGPQAELRRIMEEADSDKARWPRLGRFNDPMAEINSRLVVEDPSIDGLEATLERAKQEAAQRANAILSEYDDYQETLRQMIDKATEARRAEDEYLNRR